MIATGNHGNFDSLRGAPRPYGRNATNIQFPGLLSQADMHIFQLLYHTKSQENRDIIKTLLVAGSDLKRMQGAFSFWEAKQTVIQGAIK